MSKHSRPVEYTKYPIRTCKSSHFCEICRGNINYGQPYYDGGYGKRAHDLCAQAEELEQREKVTIDQLSGLTRSAIFNEDRSRRYRLMRSWKSESLGHIGWAMLNPSNAGEGDDDPTVRKCVGFSKRWGFDELTIVNLIPIVSTDRSALPPWKGLFTDNEPYLRHALAECDLFVVAWGAVNRYVARTVAWPELIYNFKQLSDGTDLYCIGRTRNGSPLHPSRAAYTDKPERWKF